MRSVLAQTVGLNNDSDQKDQQERVNASVVESSSFSIIITETSIEGRAAERHKGEKESRRQTRLRHELDRG
jgi:hypothetical protein